MEQAAPGEDAVIGRGLGAEAHHVGLDPLVTRKAGAGEADERGRGIDAGQVMAVVDQKARHRLAAATAKIEHGRAPWEHPLKPFEPGSFGETATACRVECGGVALIQVRYPVRHDRNHRNSGRKFGTPASPIG